MPDAKKTNMPNLLTRTRTRELAGDISDTTLKRLMKEEGFPKPATIGHKTVWVENEVAEWLVQRIRARTEIAA